MKQEKSNDKMFKILLKIGEKQLPFLCKQEDEALYRQSADAFNATYAKYKQQQKNFDDNEILLVTGFHFAMQSIVQEQRIKKSNIK